MFNLRSDNEFFSIGAVFQNSFKNKTDSEAKCTPFDILYDHIKNTLFFLIITFN